VRNLVFAKLVTVACLLGLCFSACESEDNVKSLSLDPDKLELSAKGQTETLKANAIAPIGAPVGVVSLDWKSSDLSVVTVDNGKVTALKSGVATITGTFGKVSGTTKVMVSIPGSIEISPNGGTITGIDKDLQLSAVLKDDTGKPVPDAVVLWQTKSKSVATVENGKVTSVGPGVAKIVAMHADVSATAEVTVKVAEFAKLQVKPAKLALKRNQKKSVTVVALDAKNKPVADVPLHWASSNEKVAKVSDSGEVTAVGKGKAKITASANKKTATCDIAVK